MQSIQRHCTFIIFVVYKPLCSVPTVQLLTIILFLCESLPADVNLNHANLQFPHPNQTNKGSATITHSKSMPSTSKSDGGISLVPRRKPYVLALGYTEQLSAATHTMFVLGALASDWGTQMVEPYVTKSFIFGLQNVVPPAFTIVNGQQTIRLFDLYNSTEVNKLIHTGVSPNVTMEDIETFLADAFRDVTVFHFGTRSSAQTERIFALDPHDSHLLDSALETESVLECLSMKLQGIKNLIDSIETELNTQRDKLSVKMSRIGTTINVHNMTRFMVKRVLCLDPHKVYRSDTLQKHIPAGNTVIFTNWRGCGLMNCFITNDIDDKTPEWKDKFRYAIRTKTQFIKKLEIQHQLHHSRIEKTARHYLNYLQYKHPFISIHVRSERVVRIAKETKDPLHYTSNCLKNLSAIVNNLTQEMFAEQHDNKHRILLVTDVGSKFGTSTCRGRLCQRTDTSKVISGLHDLGFHEQFYDPKVYNGIQNSGYVSLVEMRMLASAEKLVLVGFGGFQAILKNLFLSHGHHPQDVFHICNKH